MRNYRLLDNDRHRRSNGDSPRLPARRASVTPIEILSSCTACGACILTCPEQALVTAPGRPEVVVRRCSSCGECIEICPRGAIVEPPGSLTGLPSSMR
ncbi:MAG: 4Fe-4S binding protein [Acidimicrobiales bacterium]